MQTSVMIELVAVASRDPEKAEINAKNFGISKSYGSYEELLADASIEAVYLPLPNSLHSLWIRKAVEAGKHVLCEKPLSLTAKQAEESFHCAKQNHVQLMEGFMYRFHPQWIKVMEIVRSGIIGEFCLSSSASLRPGYAGCSHQRGKTRDRS